LVLNELGPARYSQAIYYTHCCTEDLLPE